MWPEGAALLRCWIRVRGCIGERWGQWLDGMAISPADDAGETLLAGTLVDQSALLGLLLKLHNLGLALLELRIVPGAGAAAGPGLGEEEHNHEREDAGTHE